MEKNEAIDVCIEDLVQAIILQAVEDYRVSMEILTWYREQKKKEKARRIELRKIRKKAGKQEEISENGGSAAGQTDSPAKTMGKEARRRAERKRKQTEKKRQKRDELIRAARHRKREVERFFHSNWFRMMSDVDPEEILRGVKISEENGSVPKGEGIPEESTEGG